MYPDTWNHILWEKMWSSDRMLRSQMNFNINSHNETDMDYQLLSIISMYNNLFFGDGEVKKFSLSWLCPWVVPLTHSPKPKFSLYSATVDTQGELHIGFKMEMVDYRVLHPGRCKNCLNFMKGQSYLQARNKGTASSTSDFNNMYRILRIASTL